MNTIQQTRTQDLHIMTLCASDHKEFFLNALPRSGETPAELLARLAEAVRNTGAHMAALNVFAGLGSGVQRGDALSETFGDVSFPVTWVEEKSGDAAHVAGAQAWAVADAEVTPLVLDGNVVGVHFDTEAFRYCRLGGITAPDIAAAPDAQAAVVFQRMNTALGLCDMHFTHVARTWFFNHHLLDWYDAFNAVRDVFFREHQVYQHVVPASTGIEGGNPAGAALIADALAVVPRSDDANVCAVPSPLQCAALEYGSSFSRAAEIRAAGMRRLYISGTASISPDGLSQFDGDVAAQTKRTMEVASAILRSRGMTLSDACRVTAYFKHAEDFLAYEAWRAEADVPDIPTLLVHNDVCRHDLLFEIELDAVCVDA